MTVDGTRVLDYDDEKITLKFVKAAVDHMKAQKKIDKIVGDVILRTIELLKRRNTLMDIEMPKKSGKFTAGDVHGQFYDLDFELNGLPSEEIRTSSTATLSIADPSPWRSFSLSLSALSEGTLPDARKPRDEEHEQDVRFEGEVKHKYTEKLMAVFRVLLLASLCAVIEKKVFVVRRHLYPGRRHARRHSEDSTHLRAARVRSEDMLWSDPRRTWDAIRRNEASPRRSADVTSAGTTTRLLVRSHEVKQEGYEVKYDGKCARSSATQLLRSDGQQGR